MAQRIDIKAICLKTVQPEHDISYLILYIFIKCDWTMPTC